MNDPHTPSEWQLAVNAAAGLRAIADCKMYGLIEGGPNIDVARCDEILEHGKARGVYPSKRTADLAIEMVALINSQSSREPVTDEKEPTDLRT